MTRRRVRIRVTGTVQGVGFRPHVHRLATELQLDGWVANGTEGVVVEITGPSASVDLFLIRLVASPPPLARIAEMLVDELGAERVASADPSGFRIVASRQGSGAVALMPTDSATCRDCLRELGDPADRRYGHPFINCTNCGPRFTIVRQVPYDRATTTMASFAMCEACSSEYLDPNDRRFHAEPICCPDCGPRLRFAEATSGQGRVVDGDAAALDATVDALRAGKIVAIKGIGGYHLAVDASNEEAVRRLRDRKRRDEKPFALLVADVGAAREMVDLTLAEEALLLGLEAPIVLARRRSEGGGDVAPSVAPGNEWLGVMLPSSGLQHLLTRAFGRPLVMTSGNCSDEPIAFADTDAFERLAGIADAFLSHNRSIHRRADDSVVRVDGRPSILRRARGYAPRAIPLRGSTARPGAVLAVGAELKSTVCLTRGSEAVMSAHLGDLEHVDVHRSFIEAIRDLESVLGVRPELIVHDLHPEYLSTKWAQCQDVELLGVQHHHAHLASCLAENGLEGPVVGLAFDGHGYGPDGTLWGGECLVADLQCYTRIGHLDLVSLPGGSTAIREPWRMAVPYLLRAYEGDVPDDAGVVVRNTARWGDVAVVAAHPTTMRTSSVGRLFDAVAAILGIRDRATFEGQAAIGLEQAAWRGDRLQLTGEGRFPSIDLIEADGLLRLDPTSFVRWLCDAQRAGQPVDELAWYAHRALADASVALALAACEAAGLATVALSGGVFQNTLLTTLVRSDLEARGVRVLTHTVVPANDGGISLGQVAIGRARGKGIVG